MPPQVAVDRFARMQVMAAGAGRGQRGGDLLADQAGFAHAGDDDAALAAVDKSTALTEFGIQPVGQPQQRLAFDLRRFRGA